MMYKLSKLQPAHKNLFFRIFLETIKYIQLNRLIGRFTQQGGNGGRSGFLISGYKNGAGIHSARNVLFYSVQLLLKPTKFFENIRFHVVPERII